MKWLWVAAFWMQKCTFSGISSVDPLLESTNKECKFSDMLGEFCRIDKILMQASMGAF